jgi:AcrR family transcriptional regulator
MVLTRRTRLDAAARRATILAAAVPMFASLGYEQTRMSDVAARVGITEPVIFQNFGSKAAVFAAALEQVAEEVAQAFGGASIRGTDVVAWLSRLLAAEQLDRLHTGPMFGVLFAEANRLHQDEVIHGALHRAVSRIAQAAATVVERAQVDGVIRADVAPLTIAWLLVSLIHAREFRRVHTTQPSARLESDLLRATLDVLRSQRNSSHE